MRPPLRTRLFAWLLPRLPGGTVAGARPEAIARMQDRTIPDTPITRAVMGRPLPRVAIDEVEVDGAAGALPARRYRPDTDRDDLPIVVYLHGGGWVLRDLELADWLLTRVAQAVPAVVVSVDYRVAPDHPFPAPLDDAVAAIRWVAAHGRQTGGDPTRLAVVGDSAGANLAAVAALQLRGEVDLAAQVLLYPPVDLTGAVRTLSDDDDPPILSREGQRTFRELYVAGADPTDPRVSPVYAPDHTGLPPTLIIVGDHDPLIEDARHYGQVLEAAGVPVRLTVYLGAVHGFLYFPGVVDGARQAAFEIVSELRRRLHPDRPAHLVSDTPTARSPAEEHV